MLSEIIEIIAKIEEVLLVFLWIGVVVAGSIFVFFVVFLHTESDTSLKLLILLVVLVCLGIFYTWLIKKLQTGVTNRNPDKIKEWVNIHLIFLVLKMIGLLVIVIANVGIHGLVFVFGGNGIYRVWTLFVARKYLEKLEKEDVRESKMGSTTTTGA